MQMENATRSPSFILPFFQSQDQPHKNGTVCYTCKWKMPLDPLHHAWYSFKVKIKCGKDGSVNFSFSTINYKGDDTNSFFLQIQLLANGLVRCKEGGLEQHFLYEVRNYA